MNNFINTIRQRETDAANLFIKNCKALKHSNITEVARELTDLRVQLEEARGNIDEVKWELETTKEATLVEWLLLGLFIATLILVGFSYIYVW